jgi:ribosome-binding ATPase
MMAFLANRLVLRSSSVLRRQMSRKRRTVEHPKPAKEYRESSSARRGVGLVGLPNVGKSSLFNALTQSNDAASQNRPFTTIEANIARVEVSDERADQLESLTGLSVRRNAIEFVDIAGLVQGAAGGAGLGNQFLSDVRRCQMIAHVIRCFEDDSVTHVIDGALDSERDRQVINAELLLADLALLEKLVKSKRVGGAATEVIQRAMAHMGDDGLLVGDMVVTRDEFDVLRRFDLLTMKPQLLVLNVAEQDMLDASGGRNALVQRVVDANPDAEHVVLASKLEAEIAAEPDAGGRGELLRCYALGAPCIVPFVRASRALLRQQSFFTVGVAETNTPHHQWLVRSGATAVEAAECVHSDFRRNFIKCEATRFEDFVETLDQRRAHILGADAPIVDGDILHFKIR